MFSFFHSQPLRARIDTLHTRATRFWFLVVVAFVCGVCGVCIVGLGFLYVPHTVQKNIEGSTSVYDVVRAEKSVSSVVRRAEN